MAMESWMYGDPETVAIRRQQAELSKQRACGACVHKVSVEWNGVMYHGCEFKRRVFGNRCELYRVKQETACQ
ncbi:hypothetical protein S2091_2714 [Solimicrobium silvestre]|uniref:Uncharacterized protein n=1 Tax=Solimicrobium silvestre TaxID=2099400 RepID=A0A2S9GY63_9BURK|nr:hypothetical protein S2091_2714 [Solimicrobium silvestre]